MRCSLWAVPETVVPLDNRGTVYDLYKVHGCCGHRCDQYKDGVFRIPTDDADGKMPYGRWEIGPGVFMVLNGKTGGLLRRVVGEYEEGECVRIFRNSEELKQIRVIVDSMEQGFNRAFLTVLLDYAESALQEYGKEAVISNS